MQQAVATTDLVSAPNVPAVVMLPASPFIAECAAVVAVILWLGQSAPMPVWLLATEVLATIFIYVEIALLIWLE